MDGPVFDAMLKTALEEALRLDAEEAPAPVRTSRRHRRRMRRMLADPWGYARRGGPGSGWQSRPVRWLAAVAVAALLTGTAAGYALRRGESFRQMFEDSPWAEEYGDAADTEQLLDMGGELDTAVVASDGLRFEMLDAVSDGQMAMVSVRMTVLEKPGRMAAFQDVWFDEAGIVSEAGSEISLYGVQMSSWRSDSWTNLDEGQYALIFTVQDLALTEGGRYEIHLKDLAVRDVLRRRRTLLSGEWTLAVTLRPADVLELYPERVCEAGGARWRVEQLTLSPLAMTMDFRRLSGTWDHGWDFLDGISINLRDGRVIDGCSTGAWGSGEALHLTVEFHMPMNVSQMQSVTVCGEEILLK